jgi:arylsulfatase A-like enzyme
MMSLLLVMAQPPTHPNVILIVADDLGYADVGFHGSEIHTPNIDGLALGGTRLNRFYGHSICTPSRSALMSGIYPHKTGTQRIIWPWNDHGLPTTVETLGTVFKKNGYATWAFGKWNLGHAIREYLPLQRGFDHHIGSYTGCLDVLDHTYCGVHDFHEDGKPIYPKGYAGDLITNSLVSRIKSSNGPFFAYLAYNNPHVPYKYDPKYSASYNYERGIKDRSDYAAMVSQLDDNVGQVLKALKDANLYDNTYVWLVSDNGGWTDFAASNLPLRGGKISPYDGGVRLVSCINGPRIKPQAVIDQPIHVVDVLPTLCGLAGIPSPLGIDGIDMSNSILNPSDKLIDRTFVLFLFGSRENPKGSVIKNMHKLILLKNIEVYDLANDPSENTNIQDPSLQNDLIKELLNQYDNYKPDPDPIYPGSPPPGYVLPKYWGEPVVKMLQIGKPSKPIDGPYHMMLGYPKDTKNVMD